MRQFDPVSALSPEFSNIRLKCDLDEMVVDPAVTLLATRYALPVSVGNPLVPARPAPWYSGRNWLAGRTHAGFVQQCPIRPGSSGPVLTRGQKYDGRGMIEGSLETPVNFAGTQTAD